jgi:hypothetical protein
MLGLSKLAEQLLEQEVIFSEDLEKIFGPRPWAKKEMAPIKSKTKKSVPAKKKAIAKQAESGPLSEEEKGTELAEEKDKEVSAKSKTA